jgi:predicted enzyme related to lactoylglutathione lyase
MEKPSARIAYVNILARDIERLSKFYADLFGFPEIEGHRSPIYRCLDAGAVELGFNAPTAYELLGLKGREPGTSDAIRAYVTIEVVSREMVEAAPARVVALGGRVIKAPYVTYYNAWQAVLEDPEGNMFRINHRMGARQPWAEIEASGKAPFKVP